MLTPAMQGSPLFQTIDQFRHRDDRGNGIQHNGLASKTTGDAAKSLWRSSSGWPDTNADGTRLVSYEFRAPPADPKQVWQNKTGFSHILENQRQQTRRSLESIADVANVEFSEGPRTAKSEGHISIGNYGQKVDRNGRSLSGNPHAVLRVDDINNAPVHELGPKIEHHPRFPARVNVGFLQVIDRSRAQLRVWERGAGETQACGTGACAAAVAAISQGWMDSPLLIDLPGGRLSIEWAGPGHPVMMTGPATRVYEGQVRL